jgi:hypothetical protein
MERNMLKLKEEIMSALSSEVDKWLSVESGIKTGLEYEEAFIQSVRRMNSLLLEKSLGNAPSSRNGKKNFKAVLGK